MSETIQKLLRMKRWEPSQEQQEQLASRILNQIEAERAVQPGLRSRIAELLDFKAALACAFSAIAIGLLLFGLGLNEEKPRPLPWSPDNHSPTLFVDEQRFYNAGQSETSPLPSLESAGEMLSSRAWRTPTVSNIQTTATKPSPPLFPTFRNPQLLPSYEQSILFPFNTNRLLQPAGFHR